MKEISVLLPSRGRFDALKNCINDLIDKSCDSSNFEVLIRIDNDDTETMQRIDELPYDKVDISVITGDRLGGYADLHVYVNELCAISRGRFLFLYNDDSKITTQNWDMVISKENNIVCLDPIIDIDGKNKHGLFPIMHRKIYEVLGFFSTSPHNDSWVMDFAEEAGIRKELPELQICHFRTQMKDKTQEERTLSLPVSQKKHVEAIRRDRDKAVDKIQKFLGGK
jgi:hypothetical protein